MKSAAKYNKAFQIVSVGARSLILILTTGEHRYTHATLQSEPGIEIRVLSYSDVLTWTQFIPATYIFTDIDRMAPPQVQQLARIYRWLRKNGAKVLNDPARMLSRFGLLRSLNRAGINLFDAYRADSLEVPRRWPVFLRMEGDHSAPVSELLHNAEELDAALKAAVENGFPRSALVAIEYAAEPVRPGLFRKLSVFRIGDRLLGYTCVHDDNWLVKYGKPASAPLDLYEEEYEFVSSNPFGSFMRSVFDLAQVDYGRVDFGLVGGRPQIYEINTNPDIKLRPKPSPIALRNESLDLFRTNYLDALRAIDLPQVRSGPVEEVEAS